MKIEDLEEMYPTLNRRMLDYFLNYALRGTVTSELTFSQLESSFKSINPNVIFNLPGILTEPQSPMRTEDLKVKLFSIKELVMLACLATTYIIKLKEKYKSDGSKIKREFDDNCVKVLLDKAARALEPDQERLIKLV
jgi:hypothetical protein